MRIAFVNQPFDNVRPPSQNSLGIWTYEVARRLAKRHEVTIYTRGARFRFWGVHRDDVRYRFVPEAIDQRLCAWLDRWPGYKDPRRPRFASSPYYMAYAIAVARDLRRQGCDVVHVMNFSQFLPVLRRFNPKARIGLHMQCDWLTQLDPAWIGPRLAHADLLMGCSEFITQRIRETYPRYASRCHTLYNGTSVERLSKVNDQSAGENDAQSVLFVGRVSPEKGVHVLLDAFRRVHEQHPNARLDIVGPISSAPMDYILSLSDDPKVRELAKFYDGDYRQHLDEQMPNSASAQVRYWGSLPYDELAQLYNKATVFVFPSVWHEPFGMPVVEAMASGTPVVATRSGGISEIVQDGKTGLLVKRGEAEDLAEALFKILGDAELRRSIGEAGRQRASERFSWDHIADDLVELYGGAAPQRVTLAD